MAGVFKKKRVSKKSKLSWRKHVDVKDVDAFLEDQRFEERLGPALSLRTDNELFQVDKTPDEIKITSKQSRRLALRNAPLKCLSMLQPHTKVLDPITKRNRVRTPLERRHPIAKNIDYDRSRSGIVKLRDKNAIENRTKSQLAKQTNKVTMGDYSTDLWTKEEIEEEIENFSEWLHPECVRHNLKPRGLRVKSVPKSLIMKPSLSLAVEPPHPGASYNPSAKDHRELLTAIVEKEKNLIKKDIHLLRVTSKMFSRISQSEKDSNWLVEMSEGLPSKSSDDVKSDRSDTSDDDEEAAGYSTANPAVKNKKKDLKQKRKIREQRALQLKLKDARKEKKKIADIYKLKKLNESLVKKSLEEEKALERRKDMKEKKSKQTKVLGKVKFEEPELEFNMRKDIAGNLRNIKKEGNLLVDRFKSLQKRNVIEPTVSQGLRKRTKVKRFTKKSHQDV